MRQIVLDTETTGLEPGGGHRIIEIGCVELVNRRVTGRDFHRYLDPDRDIDPGATAVHGMTRRELVGKPRFVEIADELLEFIRGAELLIHNAAFDVAFLEYELKLLAELRSCNAQCVRELCRVLCTLTLARDKHPGQRNSLDALCRRYDIDNTHRALHGALLDARLLADVYLAMTGGQSALALDEAVRGERGDAHAGALLARPALPLVVVRASAEELAAHEALLAMIGRTCRGAALWSPAAQAA